MKPSQNQLMTTMSTSRFYISESSPSKHSKMKSRTPNLTPNRDFDKSRSMTYRSNSNFMDLSHSPSISTIRRCDNSLYERLYNQAKELKEKIDSKKNEFLQHIKKESIPKIHEVSKKIERKQELFPERLYPYHKLNKLDTEEDNSFEYAHVATVRSNPLAISGEFDNDDFRNNIDNIFCDDEEIKNLYGNKPSYVKIYRGIKHPKKEKFSFKPMLSKNTNKIIEKMDNNFSVSQSIKRCKSNNSIDGLYTGKRSIEKSENNKNNNQDNNSNNNNQFKITSRNSDSGIRYKFERQNSNNSNNISMPGLAREGSVNNWGRNSVNIVSSGNNNLINIDFIYNEECSNFNNNNNNLGTNNINNNLNQINSVNTSINFNNNPNLTSNIKNNSIENYNIIKDDKIIEKEINAQNNNNDIKTKKGPNYFDNPAQRIKSRYEMELKNSYTSSYYNLNKNKNEKLNPRSVNITNKLYSQGINFIKKKEKINEEKKKAEMEEVKKHTFKPNLNSTNSTAFNNTNINTNNVINYNSSNSSVNFASNNQSVIAKKNSNINANHNNLIESKASNKTSSTGKNNMMTNNSKYSNITNNTNNTTSTHYTKIKPKVNSKNINSGNGTINNNFNEKNKNYYKNNDNNHILSSNVNTNNTAHSNMPNIINNTTNQINKKSNPISMKKINNFNYSCEEYKTPNQTSLINTTINNVNNSLLQTPGDNRSCSAIFSNNNKLNRNESCDLSKSMNGSFYEKCQKWKENKDQKAKKMREDKSKEELDKCSFSPKIIKKNKNFFEDKFSKKDNLNKNDYVTRMLSAYNKKEQDKNFQSKIFGENVKNIKMKITQPHEFNFSQLVSRKCRENFNKARILHRAESVKNYREKLSTKIFFNQAVFEIEENIIDNNIPGQTHNFKLSNSAIKSSSNLINNKKESHPPQLVNKNMNINFNVNIMMNK